MSYPITHVVVQNTRPPSHVMTIGRLYPCGDETVFSTHVPEYARVQLVEDDEEEALEHWEDDGGAPDPEEVKVVKPRRGRRPKASQVAETK